MQQINLTFNFQRTADKRHTKWLGKIVVTPFHWEVVPAYSHEFNQIDKGFVKIKDKPQQEATWWGVDRTITWLCFEIVWRGFVRNPAVQQATG